MTTCSPQSKLDGSAAEFVPCEELRQKVNKRASIIHLKGMVEPIFEGGSSIFQAQLQKIKEVAYVKNVNAPRLIGEVMADIITTSPARTTIGFRFTKELRAILAVSTGKDLELGLTDSLGELTVSIISNNTLQHFSQSEPGSTSCEEAGDTPKRIDKQVNDRLFGLLKALSLLIMRFNLSDSPAERVCIPPTQPCIDLCKLINAVCRVQLAHERSPTMSSDIEADELILFTVKDWPGLLYQLFDTFSQCMPFFHCLIQDANSRVLNGSWNHSASTRTDSAKENGAGDFEGGAQLSSVISRVLASMRELLLNEKLPVKLLRSSVLDILLLCSGQFVPSSTDATYPEWPESGGSGNGSSLIDSEEMDVAKCYEEFLRDTKQVPQ